MIYNTSYAFLAPESRAMLIDLFQGCPVEIDTNAPLRIMISPDTIPVQHDKLFSARLCPLRFVYDTTTGINSLVLPLYSEGLVNYYNELMVSGVRPAFSDMYLPHLVLNHMLPPIRHRSKSILNSLSDAFVNFHHEVWFSGETMVTEDYEFDPSASFYTQAMESDF